MAGINIDYEESNAKITYNGVELHMSGKNNGIKFFTGDFVRDWYYCIKHIISTVEDEHFVCSSSVDHFISDGAPYGSAYMVVDYEEARLVYEYREDGILMFVPENTTPTWDELREICGDKKKQS